MIPLSGATQVFPVIGWPVEQVKAVGLFNAYFAKNGIDAVSVPLRVAPDDYQQMVRSLMSATNIGGLFVAIPHKPATIYATDSVTIRAQAAGASNVVYRDRDGKLVADLLDGEGFIRALDRTVFPATFPYGEANVLIVGCGGVGSAIAASLAERGVACISLLDVNHEVATRLANHLEKYYPHIQVSVGEAHHLRYDLAINGTPLGMNLGDPQPFALERVKPGAVIADCGMKIEMTELLYQAQSRGYRIQLGKEMMFEQSPLYLECFGWSGATADDFRALGVL